MICEIESNQLGPAPNWLRQIEQQRAAEGREWARQKLEADVQQRANELQALCPKRGGPLRKTRWRPMQLQTSVGEVNVQVQWGKSAALHRWVCPAREQWGLAPYQTVSPELQELACFTATKTRSYQARENEGAPMGSGAVASLCRQLQNRFKSCGQFWSRQGLTHLLAINVLFKNQSARFLWN